MKTVKANLVNKFSGTYVPKLHNPTPPVRPGADDNKQFKSLEVRNGQAVYHRGHK